MADEVNQPPVDDEVLDMLRELADEDNPDFFEDLMVNFIADAERLGKSILEAAAADDKPLLSRQAHTLKSSSSNIGAGGLAEISSFFEDIGRSNGDLTGTEGKQARFKAELEAVIQYLHSIDKTPVL